MNTLTFEKVLNFMVSQANHSPTAPSSQQGVQVILNGREVTFVAVDFGSTTTVVMKPQAVSGGVGEFFLPFDELLNFKAPLRFENNAPQNGTELVTFSRSMQPMVPHMVALKVNIGAWFESYAGFFKPSGNIRRSAQHALQTITSLEIKTAARSLRNISTGSGYTWKLNGDNSYVISLQSPIADIKSVNKLIY